MLDDFVMVVLCQAWQKAHSDGWGRAFCDKNFLSQATMDMILGMRTQLLGQLRAIGQCESYFVYLYLLIYVSYLLTVCCITLTMNSF